MIGKVTENHIPSNNRQIRGHFGIDSVKQF